MVSELNLDQKLKMKRKGEKSGERMPVMTKSSIVKMEEEGRLLSRKGKETYGKVFESNGGLARLAMRDH